MASESHANADVGARPSSCQGTNGPKDEPGDIEKQLNEQPANAVDEKVSAFAALGWLDRFLAVWILLAMVVGILLGNFVDNVSPALQKGEFAGVSIPIGEDPSTTLLE